MEQNAFVGCEKPLSEEDFRAIERDLGTDFPAELREHYMQFNGGKPPKTLWVYPDGQYDDIEVREFIPMRYAKKFGNDPDFTVEGRAKAGWADKTLPADLIPIAFDWGGNYFCMNYKDRKIYYFVRDVWSDKISTEKNLEINTRPVADSLGNFIDGLVPCEDD